MTFNLEHLSLVEHLSVLTSLNSPAVPRGGAAFAWMIGFESWQPARKSRGGKQIQMSSKGLARGIVSCKFAFPFLDSPRKCRERGSTNIRKNHSLKLVLNLKKYPASLLRQNYRPRCLNSSVAWG